MALIGWLIRNHHVKAQHTTHLWWGPFGAKIGIAMPTNPQNAVINSTANAPIAIVQFYLLPSKGKTAAISLICFYHINYGRLWVLFEENFGSKFCCVLHFLYWLNSPIERKMLCSGESVCERKKHRNVNFIWQMRLHTQRHKFAHALYRA